MDRSSRLRTWAIGVLTLGLCTGLAVEVQAQPPMQADCEALTAPGGLETADGQQGRDTAKAKQIHPTITSATWVAADDSLPAHCVVIGFVTTGDMKQGFNEVNFEAQLPVPWNGKLFMGGNGGFAGSIQGRSSLNNALGRGYATVATDTGHQGSEIDASWAQDNPTKVIDFGYRSVHVTAVAGKEIVQFFYDDSIQYSYFKGCSRGGGQALMEAQRFPDDFDGIIGGAPALDFPGFLSGFAWNQQRMYPVPTDLSTPVLPLAKLPLLESQVLANCDAVGDGITDGIIDDPRNCTFDPDSDIPICAPGDEASPNCLTLEELEVAKAVYNGPVNSQGQIFPGFPFGGESQFSGWVAGIVGIEDLFGPGLPNLHFALTDGFFRYLAFEDNDDGTFDFHDFDLENFSSLDPIGDILSATDPNLQPFKDHGGKIIIWNGWADPAITAVGTINYFDGVVDTLGQASTSEFARLFLGPGMLHCGGGPGPNEFDMLTALEDWVELGIAPNSIIAVHRAPDGTVDIKRPLCSYPQVARLIDSSGSTVEASNFKCVFVTEPLAFFINAGHAGAWFNSATSGQGQLIDVEPESQFMFVSWFTYTDAASDNPNEQQWYTAQGNYTGNTAVLDLFETLGGKFDDPQEVTTTRVGEVTLSFDDCGLRIPVKIAP